MHGSPHEGKEIPLKPILQCRDIQATRCLSREQLFRRPGGETGHIIDVEIEGSQGERKRVLAFDVDEKRQSSFPAVPIISAYAQRPGKILILDFPQYERGNVAELAPGQR